MSGSFDRRTKQSGHSASPVECCGTLHTIGFTLLPPPPEDALVSQDEPLEDLGAATADRQGSTALQSHTITAASGGLHLQNLIEPHDRGTMYAQELGRIQPLFQFVERADTR